METNNRQLKFSDGFRKVIELAKSYAFSADDNVVRLKHILAAFLSLYKSVWTELLGIGNLVMPEKLRFEPKEPGPEDTIYFSSQVNRILSLHGGRLDEISHALGGGNTIGLTELAAAMIVKPRGPVLELLHLNALSPDDAAFADSVIKRAQHRIDVIQHQQLEAERAMREKALKEIRQDLLARCHGQGKAVETLIAQVATAASQTPSERGSKPLSFVFLGGPGTGKSLLATEFRDGWAEKFGFGKPNILDMSRFSVEQLIPDVCGRDPCWKDGGHEGELTRLAAKDPYGVIILDNLDKAHPGALVPIATLLADGKLKDEFSGEDVSFANNIVIMMTNRGTSYLDSGKFARLCARSGGTIPREKLIEGIAAALDDETPEKAGVIREILAKSTCPILFKRHDVRSQCKIIGDAVDRTVAKLKSVFRAEIAFDREALIAFFLESLQDLKSAHGIEQTVETVLMTRLEEEILESEDITDFSCPRISIVLDNLPTLDFPLRNPSADPIAVLEARTDHRIRQAKRLDYDIRVTISPGETSLHITNLRHTVMPSIEDADWFTVTPPDVKPSDLVGLETAWSKARKLIAYLDGKSADGMKQNHILLYGPPGTGKTAFAKSVASTLDRSIICVNGSKFTTSANDTRAVRWIQELFATAERTNSIIFLDECDAIGSRDNVLPTQAPVINTLLTLLDGFEDNGVIVIGATNRPEMLDPALTRPGRLHTRIKVDVLRKKEDREKLVDIFCRKAKRSIPSPLKDFIVQATDGWAPANILNVLREMYDLAGAKEPTRNDFAQARNAEFAGEETQRAQLTSDEKRHVAIHEAGHALVAALYGHKFIQVTINGFGDNLGFLEHMRDGSVGHSETRLRENIDVALGGHAAERLFGTVSEGSESDFEHATKYARKLLSGGLLGKDNLAVTPEFAEGEHDWQRIRPKVNAILRERLDKTATLLADHKAELKAIADELVRKGTLFSDDVDSILHPAHAATER
mgnify:FL=1